MAEARFAVASSRAADPRSAVDEVAGTLRAGLGEATPTLLLAFLSPSHAEAAEVVSERLRASLGPAHLLGTTAGGVVAGGREIEDDPALSVWAASLPGAEVRTLRYHPPSESGLADPSTLAAAGLWPAPPASADAMVVLADPFTTPAAPLLEWLDERRPAMVVTGALASGAGEPGGNRLLIDDAVEDSGAVAVAIGGVRVRTLVSQGCRPVGQGFTVTRARMTLLEELGGSPALTRLREVYADASPEDRERLGAGVHLGVVIDEYREDFGRGDFLIRSVLGSPEGSTAILVDEQVEVGQTVQFHVRDADSADEDLRSLLADAASAGRPRAALLFTCNGRGTGLFDLPDHDAGLAHETLGGPALAGMLAAGEIGPVGSQTFLHGFTASMLLIDGLREDDGSGPGRSG